MKRIHILLFTLALVVVATVPIKSFSAGVGFGGQVISVVPCPAISSVAVTIRPVSVSGLLNSTILYGPYTVLYPHFVPYRPGQWVLGLNNPAVGAVTRSAGFFGSLVTLCPPGNPAIISGTSI